MVNGNTIRHMVKGDLIMLEVIIMKVNGDIAKLMDLVYINIKMDHITKVNGKMICKMGKVNNIGLMVQGI